MKYKQPLKGFKSEAQKLKMYELLAQGKIKKETIDLWEQATQKDKPLPSKLTPPTKKIT